MGKTVTLIQHDCTHSFQLHKHTMKILLLAALIELPDDNDTETESAPVSIKPFSPDELLRRLMLEVRRNPEIWSDYGPIFQI